MESAECNETPHCLVTPIVLCAFFWDQMVAAGPPFAAASERPAHVGSAIVLAFSPCPTLAVQEWGTRTSVRSSGDLVQVDVALWERDADVLLVELLLHGFGDVEECAPVV